SVEQCVGTLGIVDQHVEHVAVSPIGNGLSALRFDGCMLRVYSIKCTPCLILVDEHYLLRVANSREETADWVTRNFTGEEKPIDRPVKCKLGSGTREDEEYKIRVAPDLAHDRTTINKIASCCH